MKIMKRGIVLFLGILLILNLVVVYADLLNPNPTDENPAGGDVEAIQNLTNQIPIDSETGGVDKGKINDFKSKAEYRIDAINLWLENNASWLKIVFGMVPEISWLFTINFFIILFFLTSLVLNGDTLWTFLSESTAKLFGLVVFIILLVTKAFFALARVANETWFGTQWYSYVLRIIAIIALIVMAAAWASSRRKAKEKSDKEKEATNREALGALVKGVKEGSK